jgi:hypothetical protein
MDMIECICHTNEIVNDAYAIIIYTVSVEYVNNILKIIFEQMDLVGWPCCNQSIKKAASIN